jgi:hypothetical protein
MASAVANGGSGKEIAVYRINYIDANTVELIPLDKKTLKPLATLKPVRATPPPTNPLEQPVVTRRKENKK